MEEIFVKVKFNDNYLVSNLGNIYSLYNNRNLTPRVHSRGYLRVCFTYKGKITDFYIHRLVAEHFIGNIPNDMEVNHIDANKRNNRVDNLEIITGADNLKHRDNNGLCIKNSKLRDSDIINIYYSKDKWRILASRYNINKVTIYNIKKLKNKCYCRALS